MSASSDTHLGEDLTLFVTGRELTEAQREAVRQHVATCASCRRALEAAQEAWRGATELQPSEPSPGFDAQLFARLDALDRAPKVTRSQLLEQITSWFTLPRLALAATGAAMGIGALAVRWSGSDGIETAGLPTDALRDLEGLAVAEDLDLFRDLDVASELDLLEDFEAIEGMEAEG